MLYNVVNFFFTINSYDCIYLVFVYLKFFFIKFSTVENDITNALEN